MKEKKVIAAVLIVIVVVVAGVFLFSNRSKPQEEKTAENKEETVIPTINPDELGLTVTLRNDKKAIKFEITNTSDIESVEYQISYDKEADGEQISEALIGEAKKESGKVSITYREFGTCSSGVCRYDTVISPVTVILKITKTDGKIYQAEKTVEL